jgi:hypothetical protein
MSLPTSFLYQFGILNEVSSLVYQLVQEVGLYTKRQDEVKIHSEEG